MRKEKMIIYSHLSRPRRLVPKGEGDGVMVRDLNWVYN